MKVRNLEFFDKNGYNLNLNWNEQLRIWEGNIFFPKVSVGLYENMTIYIVEYDGNNDDVYTYPTGKGNISFQWDMANSFVDEFFMFNFDEDYEIKDTSSLVNTPFDGPLCEPLIVNRFDQYIVPLLGSSEDIERDDLLEVHIAFVASEKSPETTYKRTLIISYENGSVKHNIAKISFFAETEEEDERLKVWNENLGYNLKPEDTIIFKHSDIHEYMTDFKILNEKRKELMLEGQNIYPYIGSYKAILNAIKFFGYDNLNIVEYWRNINGYDGDYDKIYRTYVYSIKDRRSLTTKRRPISLNTKNFQKLNNISLAYNINHPNEVGGKIYDEYGLPNVVEDFDKDKRDDFRLTIEEALVKLFALKKKLNDEFMPGATIISDIIGEGNYFSLNLIGNNPQISTVNYIEAGGGTLDFTVFPNKYCYITENEDFARFVAEKKEYHHIDKTLGELGNKTIAELEEMYDDDNSDGKISIGEIDKRSLGGIINELVESEIETICDYYEEYYNITNGNIYGDAEKYGLRNIPESRNIYKDHVDDIPNDPYGDNDNVPDMIVSAKVVLEGIFDESVNIGTPVEWRIIHTQTSWTTSFSGNMKKYGKVLVQLPYLGNYDVELAVLDDYNHRIKYYKKDAIIVEPYNVDIRGFYYDARPLPYGLKYDLVLPQEKSDNAEKEYRYYLWSKNEGNVKKGIVTRKRNASEIKLWHIIGSFVIDGDILDEYIGLSNLRYPEREHWVSIINDKNSNDALKISWLRNNEGNIIYGVDVFNFEYELTGDIPFDENPKEEDEDLLYNVIKKNVDRMRSWALQEHLGNIDINSTMRNYRPDGSVSHKGPYYKFDVDNIIYKAARGYEEYNHLNSEIVNLEPGKNYEYVRYINSVVNIKPLTWVLLGFDFSRITGRIINNDYPKWTLTKMGDNLDPDDDFKREKIVNTHVGLYFTYLFEEEGTYKIKLEMMDINGNKYEMEKSLIIVDKNANYDMYHSLNDEYNKYLEEKAERKRVFAIY